ncbi:MAG: DUF4260 domain-containing protein [Gemmatimonadota bacterium]
MTPTDTPTRLLRIEGAVVLTASVLVWAHAADGSWLLFALLFLVPDLSMLGYLKGPRVGAIAYNMGHTYTAPALLAALAFVGAPAALWHFAIIWVAHIGFDRLLGYGLKLPTGFQHTHLGAIGRASSAAPSSSEPPPRRKH